MEYQTTTTLSPTISREINLQPPFQINPTSNARGTLMIERQSEYNPSQYMSQFEQKMPNQQIQLQHPGQWQTPNVFDHPEREPSQRHQHNVTLPAEEDISFGDYIEKSEHRLSPSQQASIRRLIDSESPVSMGLNTLEQGTLSLAEQQLDLSQYSPQQIPSQLAKPAWTQGQSWQLSSLSQGVQPQQYSVHHQHVQQQPVQQPAQQQPFLDYPLQSPPIQEQPIQQSPLQLIPSIQPTSLPSQLQTKPLFRGELYKNLIQQDMITPNWNEPETPRSLVVEQIKQQQFVPPPRELPVVDNPLLSPQETLPDIFEGRSQSRGVKEAESQPLAKETYERTPVLSPQNSPSTSTPRTVTNSPTPVKPEPKKSDLKQTPPLMPPQQSLQAPENSNSQRQTLLTVLKTVRPPLTERESSAIDRILSLNFNQESLFGALVLEKIISPSSLSQFRTVFTSINAMASGSTAAPAQYHSPLPWSSSDDAPSQTTTAEPNSSSNQSHSTPSKPASKPTTPKLSKKETQSTPPKSSPNQAPPSTTTPPPKQLQSPMSSPSLKERFTKIFLQYAMETNRPKYIESITSLAKTAKTILQLETALKHRGIFTAQDVVKVEQRAVMELRKERENVESSRSTSNRGVSGRGENSLENTSGPSTQLAKNASASRVGASHVHHVSQNSAAKGSNVSTLPATNVRKENAGAPSNAFQASAVQKDTGKRGRPPKVRTATQNPIADGSNELTHGSTAINEPNLNGYAPNSNGAPTNPSAPNGKEDTISDPSAPQILQRRPRKLRPERTIIARALPDRTDLDLSNTIASWPENQIARIILIAAGRDIPGEETAPFNAEFESIKNTWPELKKADLRTLEWDIIDPPKVDLLTAMRKTLETVQSLPKDLVKSGRGRGRPPINTISKSEIIPSSEFTKFIDVDNCSASKPLDFHPPTFTGNTVTGTTTGSVCTPGGNSPGELRKGMLRRQSSHSASPVVSRPSILNTPSTTSTPVTPKKRGRKPKSDLPKTPVQSPEVTPKKLTPQVVVITPRKLTTPAAVAITDDDIIDITPTRSSRNASSRQSTTSPLVKRIPGPIAKSTPKRSVAIDLTEDATQARKTPKRTSAIDQTTAIPLAIPLNSTDSSSDESPQFTPSLPKPVKKQAGYKSYPCRWQACQAELHSFDTLEQHIIKIHGKPDPVTNVSSK